MHSVDAFLEVGDDGVERLASRERQELTRQALAAIGGRMHRVDRLQMLGIGQSAAQKLRVTADDHQEIVEVVRNAARQLAERFHLLRLRELLLRPLERCLRLPSLGNVACNIDEPDEGARLVANRLDDGARPEQTLVAPYAPAFDGAFALVGGHMERARGLATELLLLGVEPAEMLPDDFRRGVLVNALRPHVPVGDVTAAVEHENRVIGDALDDRAEAPFALHQRLLRLAALGDVVLERRFDALALLDLAMKDRGRLLEGRCAFLDRFLQLVMRALQILFGAAAVGHVLRDHHEVTHGAAAIRDRRHVVADPQARTIGQHVSRLDDESLSGVGCLAYEVVQVGQVLGLGQIFDSHLQQLRRRTPNDAAKAIVHQDETPRGVDLGDAHDGLAEHRAERVLLLAQFGFDAFSRRDMRTQSEARNRNAQQEGDQQHERILDGRAREWPAARQRAPGGKARQNEHGGGGVPLSAPQRGPQQRQRRQERQRAPVHALLDERTEGDKAHRTCCDNGRAGGQDLVEVEGAEIRDRPQHHDRRDHKRARRVTKPPRHPDGDEVPRVDGSGEIETAGADERADHRAGPEPDQGELRDAGRRIEGSAALRPSVEQIAADDRFKRVARGYA